MPKNLDEEKLNPCLKEQRMTYKCFNEHNFDKEKCALYIENYKQCKTFWGAVQSERRKKGIHPYLPEVHEREQIKQDYMKTKPT